MQRCAYTQLHWTLLVCETLVRESVVFVYMCLLCVYMKKQLEQGQQASCKSPDGKWYCRAWTLCDYSSILSLQNESHPQEQHINEWVWGIPTKLYTNKC